MCPLESTYHTEAQIAQGEHARQRDMAQRPCPILPFRPEEREKVLPSFGGGLPLRTLQASCRCDCLPAPCTTCDN